MSVIKCKVWRKIAYFGHLKRLLRLTSTESKIDDLQINRKHTYLHELGYTKFLVFLTLQALLASIEFKVLEITMLIFLQSFPQTQHSMMSFSELEYFDTLHFRLLLMKSVLFPAFAIHWSLSKVSECILGRIKRNSNLLTVQSQKKSRFWKSLTVHTI